MNRLAVVLAVVAIACGGRPAPDASGVEIYDQLCARCHGSNLEGGVGPNLGLDSRIVTEDDEYLRVTIISGRGSMPSFRQTLTEKQIARVIEYLRENQEGSVDG